MFMACFARQPNIDDTFKLLFYSKEPLLLPFLLIEVGSVKNFGLICLHQRLIQPMLSVLPEVPIIAFARIHLQRRLTETTIQDCLDFWVVFWAKRCMKASPLTLNSLISFLHFFGETTTSCICFLICGQWTLNCSITSCSLKPIMEMHLHLICL